MEARIVSQRIEHWIEPEQGSSKRRVARRQCALIRYREQFLKGGYDAIRLSCLGRDPGENLDRSWPIHDICVG